MHYFRYLLFLTTLLLALSAAGQTKSLVNRRLKRELDSIDVVDQRYRKLLMGGPGTRASLDSVARAAGVSSQELPSCISRRMIETDSMNIKRIGQIIARYGYPGRTLVGVPTNEVALLVIQHSTRIPKYLPLVRQMATKGEVPFYLYARMLDRHLMQQGKLQLYGTQGCGFNVPNPTTGKLEMVTFIWPIEDATHVNARRKKAGFDSTVEENSLRLGIPYKPMTLAEAQRIERAAKAAR